MSNLIRCICIKLIRHLLVVIFKQLILNLFELFTNNASMWTYIRSFIYFLQKYPKPGLLTKMSSCGEKFIPPDWFMCLASLNHVILVISGSVNFLIYCTYGNLFKTMLQKLLNRYPHHHSINRHPHYHSINRYPHHHSMNRYPHQHSMNRYHHQHNMNKYPHHLA